MKSAIGRALAAALLAATQAGAVEIYNGDKGKAVLHGRGQMIGVGQLVPDPYRDHARIYLFMKQARLGVVGNYEDMKYETQFSFGGENTNGSNTDLGMLDFFADIPLKPLGEDGWFKIGQFRVPYGREGLTDRGYMNFSERSIANMASFQTRDYGLALMKAWGNWKGTVGVFSGGGRDVPQRYLPERLGFPETVVRFGWDDGVDEDIYHVKGTNLDNKKSSKAAYLNALYMQDTLIGHGVVMNLRTIDKNLLVDANYNPFITSGGNNTPSTNATLQRGSIWFAGGDAAIRHPLGEGQALEAEAQVDYGGYSNRYGSLHIGAARAQASYQFRPYQAGVRYAALMMDRNAGYITSARGRYSPGMGSVIHEITPSLTWHIKGQHMKLVADAPLYLNMPVYIEKGVGSYVFASQPGQVTTISGVGGTVKRYTVFEGRMMFQFMF